MDSSDVVGGQYDVSSKDEVEDGFTTSAHQTPSSSSASSSSTSIKSRATQGSTKESTVTRYANFDVAEETESSLLQRSIIDREDLLRLLLSYLDISSLTGLYVAVGRRCWKEFCKGITVIHTGYYTVCPNLVTNEEFFPQLFNPSRAFSTQVLNQIHHWTIFARELPDNMPCYAPLSFVTVHNFIGAWCRAMDKDMDNIQLTANGNFALEYADDPSVGLVQKVNMSKHTQYHLRFRCMEHKAKYLRKFVMDSPYTSVAEGESALNVIRENCPLLERLDLLLTLSMDDFEWFINPHTAWPSLKEIEIGKLIHAFCKKLDMDNYFGNYEQGGGHGVEGEEWDTDQIVLSSVASVLTREKFPQLEILEVWTPDSERMLAIFEAIIKCWVWGEKRSIRVEEVIARARENAGIVLPASTNSNSGQTSPSTSSSIPGTPSSNCMAESDGTYGHFVGGHIKKLLLIQDAHNGSNLFDSARSMNLLQAWSSLFTAMPTVTSGLHESNAFYNTAPIIGRGNFRLGDPRLQQFCLFPNLQQVSFLPDMPSPYFMLMVNSKVGQVQPQEYEQDADSVADSNSKPAPLEVQVKGYQRRQLMDFLENFYQENRWQIHSLDLCSLRTNCSTDFRRNHLGSRRRYAQAREFFVDPITKEVISEKMIIPPDASEREYLMNCYWKDYGDEVGDDEDGYQNDGLLEAEDEVDSDRVLQESSKAFFQSVFHWHKFQHLQSLSIQLTSVMAMINLLDRHNREESSNISARGVFEVALPRLQTLQFAFNVVEMNPVKVKVVNRFVRILGASLKQPVAENVWSLATIHWRVFTGRCWSFLFDQQNGFTSLSAVKELKNILSQRSTAVKMIAQYDTEKCFYSL